MRTAVQNLCVSNTRQIARILGRKLSQEDMSNPNWVLPVPDEGVFTGPLPGDSSDEEGAVSLEYVRYRTRSTKAAREAKRHKQLNAKSKRKKLKPLRIKNSECECF